MMTTKPIIACVLLFVLGASMMSNKTVNPSQPRVEMGNIGDEDFNPLAEFETNSSPPRKEPKTSGGVFGFLSRDEKERLFKKMWDEKMMKDDPYKKSSSFTSFF